MNETHFEWPDPEPIKQTLLPVFTLPEANIPAAYRDWVVDVANRMQCPIDFVAVAVIVVTASIIGAGCGIKPKQKDDWLVIPNLWGGIVGRPGMLKTPAVSEVMQLVSLLESDAKQAFDASLAGYQAELEDFKAEKEALKSAMLNAKKQVLKNKPMNHDAMTLKNQFAKLVEPVRPIWKRYKTNDATIEKLSELLADNPRGLLIYRDELIGLLSTWNQEGRESDRAFFLEAWNGYGSLTSDRIGRGTVHTENLCVSIFGSTQPARLMHYLYHAIKGSDNDGLLQRFQLLVYPDEPKGWKLIDQEPNQQAKQRAFNVIQKLVNMDFMQHGASKESKNRFPYFRFDQAAQDLFFHWLSDLENEMLEADDQPLLVEHISKYRSLVPSLALIFHLIDVADGANGSEVSYDATLKAIAWCHYLHSHARRIYGLATDSTHESAARLAKKIQARELAPRFSTRDVYRKHWGYLDDKESVKNACDELMDAGWLRKEAMPYEIGRPRLPFFVVNPKIKIEEGREKFSVDA